MHGFALIYLNTLTCMSNKMSDSTNNFFLLLLVMILWTSCGDLHPSVGLSLTSKYKVSVILECWKFLPLTDMCGINRIWIWIPAALAILIIILSVPIRRITLFWSSLSPLICVKRFSIQDIISYRPGGWDLLYHYSDSAIISTRWGHSHHTATMGPYCHNFMQHLWWALHHTVSCNTRDGSFQTRSTTGLGHCWHVNTRERCLLKWTRNEPSWHNHHTTPGKGPYCRISKNCMKSRKIWSRSATAIQVGHGLFEVIRTMWYLVIRIMYVILN